MAANMIQLLGPGRLPRGFNEKSWNKHVQLQPPPPPTFFHRQSHRTAARWRRTPKGQDGCARDRRRGVWKLAERPPGLAGSGPRGVRRVHFRGPPRGGERRGERGRAAGHSVRISGEYPARRVPLSRPGLCLRMCRCHLRSEGVGGRRGGVFNSADVLIPCMGSFRGSCRDGLRQTVCRLWQLISC